MMTLEVLKREAELDANDIDLDWDKLNDQTEAEYFMAWLNMGEDLIPTLESLYTKLTSGKSVILPDTDTSLDYADRENYVDAVATELQAAYMLREIRNTYEQVNRIIALSSDV